LLLDEPTSHLDIGHQVDVLDLVHGMCADQGVTVVGVFHDLNLASMYCDQIIMMADGTARLHGTPRKVLTQRNVEAIYGDRVVVDQHPVCGVPLVVPVSGGAANRSALRQENSEREDMNA
jgi:iron complex transport system ATP-binding protein